MDFGGCFPVSVVQRLVVVRSVYKFGFRTFSCGVFGFLVGFEDGVCAFGLGATLEKFHFSPARDFMLFANLCAAAVLGRMILTNFLLPLNSS